MILTDSNLDNRFEFFEHTADIGLRVFADDPAGVLNFATKGFYAVIGELSSAGSNSESLCLTLLANDRAELLREYLNEVLFIFDARQLLVSDLQVVKFSTTELVVELQLAKLDESASRLNREVKAVSYHALEFFEVDHGYQAELILDI